MSVPRNQHQFSRVPSANIPRSSFDRSFGHKTTLMAGQLIPIYVDEALPGDTFNLSMTGFARLATPLHPIMDNIYFNTFFFAVPIRLIWDNWQKFNGEQRNPGDSTDYLVPQIVSPAGTGWPVGSLSDYFGLPTGIPGLSVSSFHHRAYNLIWNEWFRDQNLQQSLPNPVGDGPDSDADFALRRRGKRHDYFTSSLPWPQKGESVSIPLGTTAPLALADTGDGLGVPRFFLGGPSGPLKMTSGTSNADFTAVAGGTGSVGFNLGGGGVAQVGMRVDLTDATAATINQLRQAFQVQKLYERDARGGTRYTELIRSHFGVVSPDARLQRPEYLGGGQSPVNIHQVEQTAPGDTDTPTPQGNLAAFGTSVMSGHGFSKSFTEHCVVIGLVSIRADLNYQQGINRMWSRRSRFDFYWPALAMIGEQAVLSQEIYADGTSGDQTVWGYQERFAEYRYKPSVITGQMRSSYAQSLDTWHLAQDYSTRPLLNDAFIQDNPPIDRIIAVPSEPHFIGDFYFRTRAARPMPTYGVPGLIDHF